MGLQGPLFFIWIAVWNRAFVAGGCNAGFWGPNCSLSCGHCYTDPVVCDQITGYCNVTRCANGYEGRQCMKECDPGSYGGQCSGRCGHCRVPPCNFITGRCINDECGPGYRGLYCTKPCDVGLYGNNCNRHCGHCKGIFNVACNFINGTCQDGCQDGFQGRTCQKACSDRFYGANCTNRCGKCKHDVPCDKISGVCTNGCQPGFTGAKCKTGPRVASVTARPPWLPIFISLGCVMIVLLIATGLIYLVYKHRERHHLVRDYPNNSNYESCAPYTRPVTPDVSNGEIQNYDYGRVADWYEEIRD